MAEARSRWLWAGLAATAVAVGVVAWGEEDDAPAMAPVARSGRVAVPVAAAQAPSAIALERMTRPAFDASAVARIASAWEPPPPPARPAPRSAAEVAAAAAAAAPKPPPLPFRFVGRFDDGERPAAIVLFGQVTLVLRAGDTVERNYRVEEVGARELVFTYLPLKERQATELGGRS
jgi:hypothetical protein